MPLSMLAAKEALQSAWLEGVGVEGLEPPEKAQDSLCEERRLMFRKPSASLCLRLRI